MERLFSAINISDLSRHEISPEGHLCPGQNATFFDKYFIFDWVIFHFHNTSYLTELCVFW